MAEFGHDATSRSAARRDRGRARALPRRVTTRSSPTPARRATRWRPRRSAAAASRCPGSTGARCRATPRFGDVLASMGCTSTRRPSTRPWSRARRRRCAGSTSTWSTSPTSSRRSPPSPRSPTRRHESAASGFIRAKESDRLGDLCAELRRLGAAVTGPTTGCVIEPTDAATAPRCDTHHDHRLAMAFGLIGLRRRRCRDRRSRCRIQELAGILDDARRRLR